MPTHRTRTSAVVQARFPLELIAQAEQYAAAHGTTLSALLREGLALRLASDAVPDRSSDTSTVELSGTVRQHLEQYIDQRVEQVVSARLASAGHARPTQEPAGRRARQPIPPPPDSPSDVSYDPTRFYLAPLCKRGHDWQGTGQSLLRRQNSNCVACQRELRRARARR
jgi:hypothetical protein